MPNPTRPSAAAAITYHPERGMPWSVAVLDEHGDLIAFTTTRTRRSAEEFAASHGADKAHPARQFDAEDLNERQRDGLSCIACDRDLDVPGLMSQPVGFGPLGQVFSCCECVAWDAAATRAICAGIADALVREGRALTVHEVMAIARVLGVSAAELLDDWYKQLNED
ncbi:hypothetical protein AB0C34_01595 [Nocardia sp. NPDC049220]|uniref:hypothetical protein n=1 Tax=Nocardia sp. NPDC049220 TaxID=3155273 RepID=UPI0034088A0B